MLNNAKMLPMKENVVSNLTHSNLFRESFMQPRNLLRTQLLKAWKNTIDNQYQEQLINSERGLQVYFCSALIEAFNGVPRRIFVEPRLSIGPDIRYPDLVICSNNRIIGVVELKYLPRAKKPSYDKDLDTLQKLAEHSKDISLSNDRYLGIEKKKKYSLANDAVLCWAGVYQAPLTPLKNLSDELQIGERFLALHALTASGEKPEVKDESS